MPKLIILLFSVIFAIHANNHLPEFIKSCSKSDSNFRNCVRENAKAAIPHLLKGNAKLGLPSFQPLKIAKLNFFDTPNLKLTLYNVTVNGIENIVITDLIINSEQRNITFNLFNPKLDIVADYGMNGRILFFPIKGNGSCRFNFSNGNYSYSYIYDIKTRNGINYGKINSRKSNSSYLIKSASFYFGNLFNGDERLGEETNRLINQNWKILSEEFEPSINQALLVVYESIGNIFYRKIPLNEFLLS